MNFIELLTVLFVGLKLTNYIDWSWWWVLSPTWISWLLAIAALVIYSWLDIKK
jgi:phosphatidylglycerophosphatase A